MTILKLLDHCYKEGVKVSFEYDPYGDLVKIATINKHTNIVHTHVVTVTELRRCKNPDLILDSLLDKSLCYTKEDKK